MITENTMVLCYFLETFRILISKNIVIESEPIKLVKKHRDRTNEVPSAEANPNPNQNPLVHPTEMR